MSGSGADSHARAERLKEEGNQFVRSGHYDRAVSCMSVCFCGFCICNSQLDDAGNWSTLVVSDPSGKAFSGYSQAIELDTDNHIYWANRSLAYFHAFDYTRSLADAVHCARLDPTFFKAPFRQGRALLALRRFNEAVQAFEKGMKYALVCVSMRSRLHFVVCTHD